MKKIIIILFILILFLLIFFISDKRQLTLIERLVKDSTLFIERVINEPINYINNNLKKTSEKQNLYKKYQELKKENEHLKLENNKYAATKRELVSLKDNLNLKNSLIDYNIIDAYVINRNIGYFYNKLIIDKGKKNNIKKDMIVINSKGLIGKIIKVSNYTSVVKLITGVGNNYQIGVYINNEYGLIKKYEKGYFIIEGITSEINKGDSVLTLGLNGIPADIPIAYVEKSITDKFNLSKKVYAKPYVNFDNLDYVMVLAL